MEMNEVVATCYRCERDVHVGEEIADITVAFETEERNTGREQFWIARYEQHIEPEFIRNPRKSETVELCGSCGREVWAWVTTGQSSFRLDGTVALLPAPQWFGTN